MNIRFVAAVASPLFALVFSLAHGAGFNDTGINFCGDASTNSAASCAAIASDTGTFPRQDARFGRDAASVAGQLAKTGDGDAGFDFTALDAAGLPTAPSSGASPHPCVKDNVTGLLWEVKTANGGLQDQNWSYSWYDSRHNYGGSAGAANGGTCKTAGRCDTEKYVDDINATGLCGYSDWRMPTVKELQGIAHLGSNGSTIDSRYFPNTPNSCALISCTTGGSFINPAAYYWSGSPDAGNPGSAWHVSFATGGAYRSGRENTRSVRLVRGAAAATPIGAGSCTDTTIPPSNPDASYVDHDDGTVTDSNTGLMWKRCSEGQTWSGGTCNGTAITFSWGSALSLATVANLGGYADWRLPNVKELRSLVEECRTGPAIDIAIFPNTPNSSFWTSSPFVIYSNDAWTVNFSDGSNFVYTNRADASVVRLVRAGESTQSTTATTDSTTSTSSTSVSSTTTTTLPGSQILSLSSGWNLVGNGVDAPIAVASYFGDTSKVNTVWKWVRAGTTSNISFPAWAFYTPTLADGGASYAANNGYDLLTTINAGEGFWVNAKNAFQVQLSGSATPTSRFADGLTSNALPSGWSLIAIGDNKTPFGFANGIAASPPAAGAAVATSLTSLWAWDANQVAWYFFAPSLVNIGTQANYITSKGYLDFGTTTLTPTTGFWVNHP